MKERLEAETRTNKANSILGFSWNLFGNVTANGLSFLVGVVLARILSPNDFGLVGMISILLALSNSIVDSGMTTSLIRKLKVKQEEYDTAFLINIGLALILYLFLFFLAPFIAQFFNESRLTDVLRVLSLIVIVNSIGLVHQVILMRNVDFKPLALGSLLSAFLSGVAAILLAINGFSYWSIVWQLLIKQFLFSVFLWWQTSWRPEFFFSKTASKQLLGFGTKVFFSSLITSFQQNVYYLIIGKLFSVSTLGYYNRAESFNSLATSNITGTFSKVFFPILSSIQDNAIKLRNDLVRVNCFTFFISAIVMIFLTAMANPLIRLLLGNKWIESAWMLQLMCLSTLTMSLNALNRDMLFIKGRSDIVLKLQWWKFLLFIPGIFIAYYLGVKILLFYGLITSFISFLINSSFAKRYYCYSSWEQLKDVSPYLFATMLAGLPMWIISSFSYSPFIILFFQFILGTSILIVISEFFKLKIYIEIKSIVFNLVGRLGTYGR